MTKRKHRPTESELAILRILWDNGPATVRFINEELNAQESQKEIGYTTTLKLMQIMFEKGLLSREREGKMHIYAPRISEDETQQQILDKLVDTMFHGSAMKLVMQALGSRNASKEELEAIRKFLDELDKPDQPSKQ